MVSELGIAQFTLVWKMSGTKFGVKMMIMMSSKTSLSV